MTSLCLTTAIWLRQYVCRQMGYRHARCGEGRPSPPHSRSRLHICYADMHALQQQAACQGHAVKMTPQAGREAAELHCLPLQQNTSKHLCPQPPQSPHSKLQLEGPHLPIGTS